MHQIRKELESQLLDKENSPLIILNQEQARYTNPKTRVTLTSRGATKMLYFKTEDYDLIENQIKDLLAKQSFKVSPMTKPIGVSIRIGFRKAFLVYGFSDVQHCKRFLTNNFLYKEELSLEQKAKKYKSLEHACDRLHELYQVYSKANSLDRRKGYLKLEEDTGIPIKSIQRFKGLGHLGTPFQKKLKPVSKGGQESVFNKVISIIDYIESKNLEGKYGLNKKKLDIRSFFSKKGES